MAGDIKVMPLSPRQSLAEFGLAVVQWTKGRRGRALAMAAVFVLFFLGLMGMRHSKAITSKYQTFTSANSSPAYLSSLLSSPLQPSNVSLELENDQGKQVPAGLHKATPNFHLLMPALEDSPEFCKTTLSAMLLNYPPPTIINLHQKFESQLKRETARLKSIWEYLNDEKLVHDEDLILMVDGTDTWFQLPSDVMIRQYQNVLADANMRLLTEYGLNEQGRQKFIQTIVFGAEKACEGEDLACKFVPDSILPDKIYGGDAKKEADLRPARYLDSAMVMGSAKDLRELYAAAVKKFQSEDSQAGTVQSVLATMFSEQQLARDAAKGRKTKARATETKWLDWFGGSAAEPTTSDVETQQFANASLQESQQHEFSMGLDYTHSLFQPFIYAAEDELIPLAHNNATDLSSFHHAGTPTPPLHIPTALQQAQPPFWTPNLAMNNPRPDNVKPAMIDKLAVKQELDNLKPRDMPWADLKLIQNTYTGSIPAALHLNTPLKTKLKTAAPNLANLTWTSSLWYAGYERALLRAYLRAPQSFIGYHDALIGGDRQWDQRGGRGGVWTQQFETWLPWGEVDGVCGTLEQLQSVFADGKGVWLHEGEQNAETERKKAEEDLRTRIAAQKIKDEERRKKAEDERKERERERKEKEEKQENKSKGRGKRWIR